MQPQPFIYINGYPGVGKLTVAGELAKLIPMSKVFDNHLIIDPVAAIFERTDPEYQPLRKALVGVFSVMGAILPASVVYLPTQRQQTLNAIATSETARDRTWIFTDMQSSDAIGTATAMDYRNAASKRRCLFVSVILNCTLEENLARLTSDARTATRTTKLTDIEIVSAVRELAVIHRFHDEYELELDVTNLSSQDAAKQIYEHASTYFYCLHDRGTV